MNEIEREREREREREIEKQGERERPTVIMSDRQNAEAKDLKKNKISVKFISALFILNPSLARPFQISCMLI